MYEEIGYRSAHEYASSYIEELILEKKLKPGDKIPPENDLAKQLGISRLTLRESFRELERAGLINTVRGAKGGRFVADVNSTIVSNALKIILRLDKTNFKELLEARTILESASVRLATSRITEEELKQIEKSIHTSHNITTEKDLFLAVNFQFHELIAMASRNTVLVTFLQSLKNLFEKPFHDIPISKEGVEIAFTQHKKIFNAIKSRNSKLAEKLMIEHLNELEKRLK